MNFDLISLSSNEIYLIDADENIVVPKKIMRRQKKSYPLKRNNYKKYKNASWKWHDVLMEIDMIKETEAKFFKIVATKYNICRKTLTNKYGKWIENGKPNYIDAENRGNKTYFNIDEERSLFEYINNLYIKHDLFFDDMCLKRLVVERWKEIHPTYIDKFKGSRGWIYEFKKKWGLSSFIARKTKKAHYCGDNMINDYLNKCRIAYQKYGPSLVFNMDETFYRLLNGPIYSIGLTGSDHRNVITGCNDKNGFTSVFLVAADGRFYDPIIIIKGSTERCLKKTGMVNNTDIMLQYSKSGWITCDIAKEILKYIYHLSGGKQCALILDSYSVHMNEIVKNAANELKIDLIYVPNGTTATNQPLDVTINGVIKAISGRLIREKYMENPLTEIKIFDAIQCLLQAKTEIKDKLIIDAFSRACNL